MSSTAAINLANLHLSVGYRNVVPPKQPVLAACRNCAYFQCDHDDREGWKGVTFRRVNLRCRNHNMAVKLNCVCDAHQFAHADRRDR